LKADHFEDDDDSDSPTEEDIVRLVHLICLDEIILRILKGAYG